jgi:16S rRNA processing protein RimM
MTPPRASSNPEDSAGSSHQDEPDFLAVGRLRRPHGLQGEISMDVMTDFPERLAPGVVLYIGQDYTPHSLLSVRWQNNLMLLAFEGFSSPEEVGQLRSQIAYVPAADRPPLEEGEYYHHELLGLQVFTEDGQHLGRLAEILETGANDVYLVKPEVGPEILLPAVDDVILSVDLNEKKIVVHLLPGLLGE